MKKSTKLLSVLLAFVMVISVFAVTIAQAATPYKPTYNDEVTEKDVELLLKDVDTLLLAKLPNVFSGSFFESIYKALPGLTILIPHAKDVEFYSDGIWVRGSSYYRDEQNQLQTKYEFNLTPTTELNQERFKDLEKYGDGTGKDKDNIAAKDKDKYPEDMPGRFGKGRIVEDVKDENGNITKEGTFTKFFKDHPIVVNSLDDFRKELNNVVATVVMDGLSLFSALGNEYIQSKDPIWETPLYYESGQPIMEGGAPEAFYSLFEALDDISAGLGVKQTHSATECLEWNSKHTAVTLFPTRKVLDDQGKPVKDENGKDKTYKTTPIAIEYIQNIINVLFNDGALATNVVGVIQRVADVKSGALIYKGIANLLKALEDAINSPFGQQLGANKKTDADGKFVFDADGYPVVEYTGIAATLHNIYTIFQSIPTLDSDKDTKRFDIEGLVNFAIDQLNLPLSIVFMNLKEGNGKPANGLLNVTKDTDLSAVASASEIEVKVIFRHMKLDRLAEAVSSADAVKIVYDYLYDNLICNTANNVALTTAFTPVGSQSLIERLLKTDIPNNIESEILSALRTNREPLAAHLISMVGEIKEIHHHTRLQFVAAKAPTCTENGTVAYYHCPDCGLNFAIDDPYGTFDDALTSVVIPNSATGHQHVTKIAAKKATCTTAGNVEYYRCDACGRAFKSEADAAANNAFDPTVKATGHQYGEWKEVNGKQVRTCKVCGATETKDAAASNPSNPSQPDKNLPQIPVTGATVTGFSAISLLAAAAFVTMAVRSKKDRDE